MGQTFRLTDKQETKTVPCAHPGCENTLIVTKFYTPSKARCPDHAGARIPTGLVQTTEPIHEGPAGGALVNLACPAHPDTRMRVLSTASRYSGGVAIELQCPECFILVKIDTSLNKPAPAKSYVGEPTWPDWNAFLKSRDCKCGHRIAAFTYEDPIRSVAKAS